MSAIGCDSRHCENAMRSMTITSISRRATSLACYASLREREQDHMRETLATINKYAYAQYTHESSRREMLVRNWVGVHGGGTCSAQICNSRRKSAKFLPRANSVAHAKNTCRITQKFGKNIYEVETLRTTVLPELH